MMTSSPDSMPDATNARCNAVVPLFVTTASETLRNRLVYARRDRCTCLAMKSTFHQGSPLHRPFRSVEHWLGNFDYSFIHRH